MLRAFATNPDILWLLMNSGLWGAWIWNLQFEVSNNLCTRRLLLRIWDNGLVARPFIFLRTLGKYSLWVVRLRESWNLEKSGFTLWPMFSMSTWVWVAHGVSETWTSFFLFLLLSISSFLFAWKKEASPSILDQISFAISILKLDCSLEGNQSTNHNKANETNSSISHSPFET
jgi:hypothetical protein